MKKYFIIGSFLALLLSAGAAITASLRPMLLTALINGSSIGAVLSATPAFIDAIPIINLVLCLEVLDFLIVFSLGALLSHLSVNVGSQVRIKLVMATLRHFSGHAEEHLSKYAVLTKTYVDVLEMFFRQYLFQSLGALAHLMLAIFMAYTLSTSVAVLLSIEVVCLVLVTVVYSQLHMKLANARFKADEQLLSDAGNNPRKGISIWYGGLGSIWLKQRRKEIFGVKNARLKLALGDSVFLNVTTFIIGISVVVGYFVLIIMDYGTKQDFVAYFLYSGFMMGPVTRLASFTHECQECYLAVRELKKATAEPLEEPPIALMLNPVTLTATLQGGTPLVITIRAGDRVAIVGRSGSGKTTFIEALLGAKDPIAVNPLISGYPSKLVRQRLPNAGICYLSDTPVFERGTVLFNCHADIARCRALSKKMDLFRGLNDSQYSTFLDKNIAATGEPLSLGERQRIQLLRALLKTPTVLILDEALSGIEEQLEQKIVSSLIRDPSIEILIYVGHRKSVQDLFAQRIAL
jgi:ABC-type bacteriocin/lantibiotic exporter with double-glycine peptidase domain